MASLEQEVKAAIKKLEELPKELRKKERHKILRKAAKPLVQAAKGNIKSSDKPVHRYSTGKVSQDMKAPKGTGTIIASYLPDNLKRAIKVLIFRKSPDVFVGPKLAKRNNKGTFGEGAKVDGWYAHFVEFGTVHQPAQHFMRNAFDTTKATVQRLIIQGVKKSIQKYINKNKIK